MLSEGEPHWTLLEAGVPHTQAAVLLRGGELIVTMGKHCNKAATHSSPITTASSCIPYLVSHNNHHCGEDERDKGLKEEGGREERRGWKEKKALITTYLAYVQYKILGHYVLWAA